MSGYQIADEPRANALTRVAVDPVWPLFGVMFGGAWLAWPWFVLNAIALGSPTRHREIAVCAGALVGACALALAGLAIVASLPDESRAGAVPYVVLAATVWKIGSCYALYSLQARTFGIFEYYSRGKVANGLPVVAVGFLLGARFEGSLLGAFAGLVLG